MASRPEERVEAVYSASQDRRIPRRAHGAVGGGLGTGAASSWRSLRRSSAGLWSAWPQRARRGPRGSARRPARSRGRSALRGPPGAPPGTPGWCRPACASRCDRGIRACSVRGPVMPPGHRSAKTGLAAPARTDAPSGALGGGGARTAGAMRFGSGPLALALRQRRLGPAASAGSGAHWPGGTARLFPGHSRRRAQSSRKRAGSMLYFLMSRPRARRSLPQ